MANNIGIGQNVFNPTQSGQVSAAAIGSNITATQWIPGNIFQNYQNKNLITFYDKFNKEIVRIDKDGSVIWGDGIKVDDAAKSLELAMTIGAEMKSGITNSVKLKMRDKVFEELIDIAKQKGPLSADDLTYLLAASKIVEKLQGPKE